jgi:hypothetical protein
MSRDLLKRALYALSGSPDALDSSDAHKLMADIESELEKPLPKPVTYQFQGTDGSWHDFINPDHYKNTVEDGRWPIRALYAEPPARKPLTDEQIHDLWDIANGNLHKFTRAIEAAHGITDTEQSKPQSNAI